MSRPTTETEFGSSVDLDDVLPRGTKIILLCEVTSAGYQPRRVLLPHQVYTKHVAAGEWVVFALGDPIWLNRAEVPGGKDV